MRPELRGIALVELLVYMAILLVITAGAGRVLVGILGGLQTGNRAMEQVATCQAAHQQLRDDCERARRVEVIRDGETCTGRFLLPDGSTVSWQLVDGRLQRRHGEALRHWGRDLLAFDMRELRPRCYTYELRFSAPDGDGESRYASAVAQGLEARR